jgi:hypothetical protein
MALNRLPIQCYLHERADAPDLATVNKDFLRFHIARSRVKIVEKPTADSVNTTHITGHTDG